MPPHTPRILLNSLKSTELKRIAFLIGHNNSGTKTNLLANLPTAISAPSVSTKQRILSIDMGIRNLAYCVLDVPHSYEPPKTPPNPNTPAHPFDITDLSTEADHKRLLQSLTVTAWRRTAVSSATTTTTTKADTKEAFDPSTFAKLAYNLVAHTLLPHIPTQILIERQRWRSGGAPAVLEWTLRVNMFESMLHAVLETLGKQWRLMTPKASSTTNNKDKDETNILNSLAQFPKVHSVSPKKVANFWIDGAASTTDSLEIPALTETTTTAAPTKKPPNPSKSKIEKEAKITVAEAWLRGGLTCSNAAAETATAFLEKRSGVRIMSKKKKKQKTTSTADTSALGVKQVEAEEGEGEDTDADVEKMGKLDDLADCLLQGVAWAQWEANRQRIAGVVDVG